MYEGVRDKGAHQEDHPAAAPPDGAYTDSQIDAQYLCLPCSQPGLPLAVDHGAIYTTGIYLPDLKLSISLKPDAAAQAVILPIHRLILADLLVSVFSFGSGKSPRQRVLKVYKTNVHLWLNGRIAQDCFLVCAA